MSTVVATTSPEQELVRTWRREQLEEAGFPRWAAAILGDRASVDLHLARRLLRAGCPVETAWRILV